LQVHTRRIHNFLTYHVKLILERSLEFMQHNYSSALRHLVQGLRIMYDWRVRAFVDVRGDIRPPVNPDLPRVDSYVLKLFFAPSPGSRRDSKREQSGARGSSPSFERTLAAIEKDPVRTAHIRSGRLALHDIAKLTLEFLEETSKPDPSVSELRDQKEGITKKLDVWNEEKRHLLQQDGTVSPVRIDEVAMFMFYRLLQVIVTASLCRPQDMSSTLEARIQDMMGISELLARIRREDLVVA
jgi:hypothetical protein